MHTGARNGPHFLLILVNQSQAPCLHSLDSDDSNICWDLKGLGKIGIKSDKSFIYEKVSVINGTDGHMADKLQIPSQTPNSKFLLLNTRICFPEYGVWNECQQ